MFQKYHLADAHSTALNGKDDLDIPLVKMLLKITEKFLIELRRISEKATNFQSNSLNQNLKLAKYLMVAIAKIFYENIDIPSMQTLLKLLNTIFAIYSYIISFVI